MTTQEYISSEYQNRLQYIYTAGNPVMLVDPDGRLFEDPDDEIRANKSIDQTTISIEELKINKYGRDNSKYSDLTDKAKAYQVEYSYRNEEGRKYFRTKFNVGLDDKSLQLVNGVKDIVPNNMVKSKKIIDN